MFASPPRLNRVRRAGSFDRASRTPLSLSLSPGPSLCSLLVVVPSKAKQTQHVISAFGPSASPDPPDLQHSGDARRFLQSLARICGHRAKLGRSLAPYVLKRSESSRIRWTSGQVWPDLGQVGPTSTGRVRPHSAKLCARSRPNGLVPPTSASLACVRPNSPGLPGTSQFFTIQTGLRLNSAKSSRLRRILLWATRGGGTKQLLPGAT